MKKTSTHNYRPWLGKLRRHMAFLALAPLGCLAFLNPAYAQTPGLIFKRATPTTNPMDKDGNGYVSATAAGFTGTADVGNSISEIPYRSIPQLKVEPSGDLGPGPAGKFSDFADTGNKDAVGFYVDNSGNHMFRFRLGSAAPNSKGYSILMDIDGKFGSTGSNPDPNATSVNPGFEIEVVLITGGTDAGVNIYNVNGRSTGVLLGRYPHATYMQKAIAATVTDGDLDVFYDFYVPLNSTVISGVSQRGISGSYADPNGTDSPTYSTTSTIRMVANTVIAPTSALSLENISDMGGLLSTDFDFNPVAAWTSLITSSEVTTGTIISSGGTFGQLKSQPPHVTDPVYLNSSSISGYSTEAAGTTIRVTINGVQQTTTASVLANHTWTLPSSSFNAGTTLTPGYAITATAHNTAEGKLVSGISNTATVSTLPCPNGISNPISTLTWSSKGVCGTATAGATIRAYQFTTTGMTLVQTIAQGNNPATGAVVVPVDGTGAFQAKCNASASNCNSGPNCFSNGSFVITVQEPGKCESYVLNNTHCSSSSGATNVPVLNTPTVGLTTLSGSFTFVAGGGATARLYAFVDQTLAGSITLTNAAPTQNTLMNWSLPNVTVPSGGVVNIIAIQNNAAGQCLVNESI